MAWLSFPISTTCTSDVAASQLESPSCAAEISQTPEDINVTTPTASEHTLFAPDVREIVGRRPELLVAVGE